MKHRIIELPAFSVVGMEYIGGAANDSVRQLWQRFLPRAAEITRRVDAEVLYGICARTEQGAFRYVAGAEVTRAEIPPGMLEIRVPAQKYAVFSHRGTVEQIADSFQAIYAGLLAQRGLEPKNGIDFERYDARFLGPDDPASEVDLYIPVY